VIFRIASPQTARNDGHKNQMNRLDEYVEAFSMAEDPLLTELDRATNLQVIQPKMVSGRVQGAFLRLVTEMLQPKTVLEIGTFTGYSALSIAAGLADDAILYTVEVDDELEDLARSFFARSPHGHKIHMHIGAALEVVPALVRRLGQPFDMVFIDGDKREYPDYYRMLMGGGDGDGDGDGDGHGDSRNAAGGSTLPMVHSGSIILADNVLWYGKVAEPEEIKPSDRMSQGIIEFNRLVAADPRVENVVIPIRDGINLIRVR
jgi:caffeoyl-CoA O-methyltransferase